MGMFISLLNFYMKNKLIPDFFDNETNKKARNFGIDIHNLTSCYTSTENLLDWMLTFKNQKFSKNEVFSMNINVVDKMDKQNNNIMDLKSLPLDKMLISLKHRGSSYIVSTDQFIKAIEYFEDDILEELMYFDLTARQERMIKQDNAQRLSTDSTLFQSYLQTSDRPFLKKSISVNQKRMEDDVVKVIHMLEEKEKDLELAAKIGKSLLEQNQELRERNSFLHDSLTKNAETINELKHQVKYKEKLIRSIKKEDDMEVIEHEKNINNSIDSLKNKIDGLKKENSYLKNEAKELKILSKTFEEEKKSLAEEYTRYLDKANSQVSRLQSIINEKDKECFQQTKEIEKLMKKIIEQKSQEKVYIEENAHLTEQLGEMVINHEYLKEQISELQDKYIEVFEMLKEAEEELCKFRKKPSMFGRAMSSDSLYDSLASEVEVHDSGFYTTPMVSARSDSRNSNFLISHRDEENNKCKYYPIEGRLSDELAAIGCNIFSQNVSTNCNTQSNENTDDELIMISPTYKNDNYSRKDNSYYNIEHPNDPTSDIPITPIENNISILMSSTPIKESINNKKELETRDISCSPIKELLINYNTIEDNEITPRAVNNNKKYFINNSDPDMIMVKPKCQHINHTTSLGVSKSLSSSNDSLSELTPLGLGVPGRLGTRDLEFSLKKIATRREVEKDYEKHRASNGLPPSKYKMFHNKIHDIGINILTKVDNNKQISNGVVSRNNINSTTSKHFPNTPIKTNSPRKITNFLQQMLSLENVLSEIESPQKISGVIEKNGIVSVTNEKLYK
ncbi:HAP1, N-terminal domain-containing protein [Strongyloides ratti]|uniref:HAP1, N-terminal domain-containing protein n=1 Tax=Strongyloides ratti TaxID=34506 RepID=A0A090LFV4_STRRB|nr:HAP1, N-terminal domain-containing protein [Strongyloides ratti]CEF67028.1 HAP1, N-terminal domain-containing protein [Strongyloides ratti]